MNQSLEPKLNLVQEAQPYAQVNHLSYLQRGGQNYPVSTFQERQKEEDRLELAERNR